MSNLAGKLIASPLMLLIMIALLLIGSVKSALGHGGLLGPVPDSLKIAIQSESWEERTRTYKQLGYYREDEIYPLIRCRLNDPNPKVIVAALMAFTHSQGYYYVDSGDCTRKRLDSGVGRPRSLPTQASGRNEWSLSTDVMETPPPNRCPCKRALIFRAAGG